MSEEQHNAIIEDAKASGFVVDTWVYEADKYDQRELLSKLTKFAQLQASRNQSNNVPVAILQRHMEADGWEDCTQEQYDNHPEWAHKRIVYTSPQQSNALEMAAKDVDARKFIFHGLTGCSNHGCIVHGPRKGMGTNGPCHCISDLSRQQMSMLGQRLDHFLRNLIPHPESTAPQQAIPSGWKLVPIEPTAEMRKQGWQAYRDSNHPAPYNMLADAYKAMLSAAPQPESEGK